jgi:5-methylthioadenosine/S-adenosylhomocysteine deaminase
MTVALVRARRIVTGVKDDGTAEVLDDAAIAHDAGCIVAVGDAAALRARYPEAQLTDFAHHVLLPGLVNAHHHVGLTPFQLGSPDHPLELWFASRLAARDVDPHLDTLFGALEMVASGVTCVQHLHPRVAGPVESVVAGCNVVLDAYRLIGMRASFAYSVREQNRLVYADDAAFCATLPSDIGQALWDHLQRFALSFDDQMKVYALLRRAHADQPRTRIQLAPANLHWVTDDGLMAMVERAQADDVPLHMHLLETPYQREYARRRTGTTAVRHLHRLGALGPSMTLGHAVHVDEGEIELIAHTGTCVCHNCSSNMRLRSGTAPLSALIGRGVKVAMGIDEAGINDDHDMLQEMRLARRAHGRPGLDSTDAPDGAQVLRMATEYGAGTTPYRGRIGRLAVGLQFDAVAIDFAAATWPYQDEGVAPVEALLQRAKPSHVDTVFVDGDPIYAKGRFKYVDREQVLAAIARQLALPLTERERHRRWMAAAAMPHVKSFYDGYL